MKKNKRKRLGKRLRWNRVIIVAMAAICIRNVLSNVLNDNAKKSETNYTYTEEVGFEPSEEVIIATPTTGTIVNLGVTTQNTIEDSYFSERLGRYVSNYEMYYLRMICCSEAGTEQFDGKVAVVATVLNRLDDESFANSIYGVIFEENQFSSATDGVFHNGDYTWEWDSFDTDTKAEAVEAVYAALDGVDPTASLGGALFFYNPDYCSDEENDMRASISETLRIGNHIFYRIWD